MAGGSSPSIRSVAKLAGVSVATVSNVLNGKSSVTPEVAARVTAAVETLGYVRDRQASRLRSGKSRLCGVIVPDLTNPMFAAFVSTLEHLARGDGYDLVVVSTRNDPIEEAARIRQIREWRPAGLIVLPCDSAIADRLPASLGFPIVLADRIPDTADFDLVAVDNTDCAAAVVRHLVEQGVADCLVIGTSLGISNIRERWDGARGAAGGMAIDVMAVGFDDHAPPALAERLRGPDRPGAVFCLDTDTSLAVYMLIADLGLEVGRDIAFASFDEKEWMRLVRPALTAVRQPVEDMADCSWRLLCRRLAGETDAPQTHRLGCEVTLRGSTPRQPSSALFGTTGGLTKRN